MERFLRGKEQIPFPRETMIGALAYYISTPNKVFNPMNANLGILPNLGKTPQKRTQTTV